MGSSESPLSGGGGALTPWAVTVAQASREAMAATEWSREMRRDVIRRLAESGMDWSAVKAVGRMLDLAEEIARHG